MRRSRRVNRVWLIGLVLATACRQEILVLPDATTGDAGADGGLTTDSGPVRDGSLGSDAGGFDGSGADVGATDAGGSAFTVAAFPLVGALNRSIRVIKVIGPETVMFGNSSGFLGVVDSNGVREVWRTNDNSAIRAIELAPQGVAVLSQRGVFVFGGTDYTTPIMTAPITANAVDLSLLDGAGFVSADVPNGQRLYRYENNVITALADLTPGRANTLLTVANAEVYLGGYGGIRSYKAGALMEMDVAWPSEFDTNDIASFQVVDIARVDNEVHAVGSEQSVLRLEGTTWRFVHRGTPGYDFNAVTDGHFYGGEAPRSEVLLEGPSPFTPLELPNSSVVLTLDYDPMTSDVWAAGYERNGIDGRLFRLSRP